MAQRIRLAVHLKSCFKDPFIEFDFDTFLSILIFIITTAQFLCICLNLFVIIDASNYAPADVEAIEEFSSAEKIPIIIVD